MKNLELLNPQNTLSRGYSIVKQRGKILKSASEVDGNDVMDIQLADGGIQVVLKEKDK